MIEYIFKATISLAICYTFYRCFLVKESMFTFNRFYLIFSICFSLILPFLQMPFDLSIKEKLIAENVLVLSPEVPQSKTELLSPEAGDWVPSETAKLDQHTASFNWNKLFLGVYLFGLFFFLCRFILQLLQLNSLIRKNLTLKDKGFTYVLLEQKTLPFTFLNFLFLEKEAFQNKRIEEEILYHELVHIRQKHSWDILLVELMKVIFWFNPIFVLYKNAMQLNHEFLADAGVNFRFQNKTAYQWLLFNKIAGQETNLSISSPFNFSSTKSRLIMMGKSSSRLKTKLLKSISMVLMGCLVISLSSGQSYKTIPFGSPNAYEQILSKAFQEDNPFHLDLSKLDLTSLRKAYQSLDEDEKYKVTEFPFFDDLTFEKLVELQKAYPEVKTSIVYESPAQKKVIKQEIYDQWKKSKNISLTIDEQNTPVEALDNYQSEDFAMFIVRETEKDGFLLKDAFDVILMTNEYYHGKYYKAQKKIHLIQAEYPNADIVKVFYSQKHSYLREGKIVKLSPENYEASILHHLRTIDPANLDINRHISMNYESNKSFSISIVNEGSRKTITVMKLPSI